jgi:hypothetical protein
MRLLLLFFLLPYSIFAQSADHAVALASSPTVDCKNFKPMDTGPIKGKGFVNLAVATTFVVDAINQAECTYYYPSSRFVLTTADLDFQTLVDNDGTLEVLFIGGLAGELDKQVTSDTDFTYSAPTPLHAEPKLQDHLFGLGSKPSAKSVTTLAEAVGSALQQMAAGVGAFPMLSQHQVKVSIKYSFTKDGTLELEPKLGSVSITAKYKRTETNTQTLTLTFADQAPSLILSATPSLANEDAEVNLLASAVAPANSAVVPEGNITFLDGEKTLEVKPLSNGTAELMLRTLSPGVHSIMAVYGGWDGHYDSVASTPSIVVVHPKARR